MPNGGNFSEKEWRLLETPFQEIDPYLEEFAKNNKMKIRKNYHEWPERTLQWGEKLIRNISITLKDKNLKRYNLSIYAYMDINSKRIMKRKYLKINVPFDEIKNELKSLFEKALTIIGTWEEKDLSS